MPRIPTLNRMYIAPARNYNAGGTARVISQAMGIAGQIAGTINNIQDTANIQSFLTEAKNNFNNTFNEYKIKYADNPQEFNKQITNYRNNLIQDTVKNSNVSLANKNKFQQILDNNFDNFDNEIFKVTRQLQVNKIDADITNSIMASKNTSYIHGKNGNFELFVNDLSKELADVESIGKTAYSVNTLNSKLNNIKKDNAKNYIEGLILTNPLLAKSQLEEEKFNNLLDQQEIDYYLNNIIKQVENNNKDLESQGKSNNTELQAEAVLQLDNRFNDFDISGNTIKNKNLNNIDSIIDYQNFNEDLYNQGLISDKIYNTYNKKINNIFYEKLNEINNKDLEDNLSSDASISPTKYLMRKAEHYTSNLMPEEATQVIRLSYNEANKNGLLLDNKNNPAIHDIVKKNTMLVLNNLGFEPTEKDLASPGEYIRNSTYELSYRRILSKITIPIDNQTPFGDLKNITPVKKTKDTGIFVRNKKINNK